jgi:gamma-glutamylcyclotransferase (GGCT)/AIG2-like uncharacterized protein YtfP
MLKHHTHLFTYGSLMFEPVWNWVAKQSYQSSEETICGYARYKVIGEEYPAVIATPTKTSNQLQGRVYWSVDSEDLDRLDQFEGVEYERITTQTLNGHEVALYVFLPTHKISYEPWDPIWFEQTGMSIFLKRYPGFTG